MEAWFWRAERKLRSVGSFFRIECHACRATYAAAVQRRVRRFATTFFIYTDANGVFVYTDVRGPSLHGVGFEVRKATQQSSVTLTPGMAHKQDPFCNYPPTSTATMGTSSVQSFSHADTEYTPKTINAKCDRHDDDNDGDVVTLTVLANNVDPDTNDVALKEINQEKITVNGRPIIRGSCNLQ